MSEERRFGRYRVTSTIGAGAMGEVFAAVDDVLGREVAVKTLKGSRNGLAARMLDDRFRQEARAIAALSHPGVVQVFDLDLTADPPYLVMERVAGPSLKERLAEGPLPVDELRALGIQIGRALAAAHAQKIIHRDVKPANILAAGPGTWKLADFGVAHVPDSSLTMTGQFVGSPAYAPPEALVRGQCDAEGDVFGLGASLYQAAAGSWPRLDATTGGLLAPIPPIAGLVPGLPEEIAWIIDRAVAIETAHRPTASELADALAGAPSSPGATARVAAAAPVHVASPAPAAMLVAGASFVRAASPALGESSNPGAPFVRAASPALGDSSNPGASIVGLPPLATPHVPVRWQPWAIGGAAIVLVGILAARCSGPDNSPSVPGSTAPFSAPTPPTQPSGPIRVVTPPMRSEKAAKDWRKLIEKLQDGDIGGAKEKLREWERKHGATEETAALRTQLDALPERDDNRGRDD